MVYSTEYFNWQKDIGKFGGVSNLFKFRDFIHQEDTIIDYGCGGGYLLLNMDCKERIGIEINDAAREEAKLNGIFTVKYTRDLKNELADVIISNHALEHVSNPLEELKLLKEKLKIGGKIIFIIPHEIYNNYIPDDVNQHLYTWSPMCAGNLFARAGFHIIKVETLKHAWPPFYVQIRKLFGEKIFHLLCYFYGHFFSNIYQIRVIGVRKE